MPEKEITLEIKRPELILLLAFSLFVLALCLQVTFGTPINFGDEGFHTYLAQLIGQQREYFVWMPFEGTNLIRFGYARPPLWNLLEAGFVFIFGFHEAIIRFLTPFIAVVTGIAAYLLVKRLFNEKVALVTAVILITIPSFVTYSVLFYTDVLLTFYTTLALLTFLLAEKYSNKKYFLLSGVFAALAFLTKAPGIAFYFFYVLAFLYEIVKTRKLLPTIKKYVPLVAILLLVPAGFFLRNYHYYGTPSCYAIPYIGIFKTSGCNIIQFENKYSFAGRVEEVGTEASVYRIGVVNYLDFAYGFLWFVMLGFVAGLVLLITKRDNIVNYLFLFLLLFFLIFSISVSRAEDTARYTLGWAPLIALFAGIWYTEVYDLLKKYQKYLGFIVIVLVLVFSYLNMSGKLTGMAQVKQFSPTFFEACNWVKKNTTENTTLYTVWGHRAIYNCQRNAVGTSAVPDLALSKDANYTVKVAKDNGVTHFFIQKFSIDPQNQHLAERYDWEFVQFLENNPEHFQKVYENGIPIGQCVQYWQRGVACDGNIVYKIV